MENVSIHRENEEVMNRLLRMGWMFDSAFTNCKKLNPKLSNRYRLVSPDHLIAAYSSDINTERFLLLDNL